MITITDRAQLLVMLNGAVNAVTKANIKENRPMIVSKSNTIVGPISIEKNNECYTLLRSNEKNYLYTDITLYETAILIAQAYIKGDPAAIKELIEIDIDYAKHRNDMVHYLSCYKTLKLHNDVDRMVILEDKFCMAEELSKVAKQRLSKFKNLK